MSSRGRAWRRHVRPTLRLGGRADGARRPGAVRPRSCGGPAPRHAARAWRRHEPPPGTGTHDTPSRATSPSARAAGASRGARARRVHQGLRAGRARGRSRPARQRAEAMLRRLAADARGARHAARHDDPQTERRWCSSRWPSPAASCTRGVDRPELVAPWRTSPSTGSATSRRRPSASIPTTTPRSAAREVPLARDAGDRRARPAVGPRRLPGRVRLRLHRRVVDAQFDEIARALLGEDAGARRGMPDAA
jgi:hypothetical protein